ncbi:MAG: tagaturonate reductase, partial [Pedobacter sp.]
MTLSEKEIGNISAKPGLTVPTAAMLQLPERVLQFGTGVLLRGLPDYFIDKANRAGVFNGRVVVVKSTDTGGADAFDQQNGLFTLCVRGIENGQKQEEAIINSSISRVLSAKSQWEEILHCAGNPDMHLIISNTTEVGIVLKEDDDIHAAPPASFPAKLLAFLYRRFTFFKGAESSGMVIIPTELIIGNGDKLKDIVLKLAEKNKLDHEFILWLKQHNHFCNSLVDRIVPGKLNGDDKTTTEEKLGYSDDLMIMSETFRLWAIESDNPKVKEVLSFAKVDDGVVIAPDIEKFRELKLRLLNGTHTFSCGVAFLAGFTFVKDAMNDPQLERFVKNLMDEEISPSLSGKDITAAEAADFAGKVVDRFKNPFLDHQWIAITLNYTSKMKMRNLPLLLRYHDQHKNVPAHMALGFAAYVLFMKGTLNAAGKYEGSWQGKTYPIQDEMAGYFAEVWAAGDVASVVDTILSNTKLWEYDLTTLHG